MNDIPALALSTASAILAVTSTVRAEIAVPIVPAVHLSTAEERAQVAADRAAALELLLARGVTESEHARAIKAIEEIEHHARVLAAVLAPRAVPGPRAESGVSMPGLSLAGATS